MLLWQRKSAPKIAFGAQLGFVIVCMHAVALLMLCMYSVSVHDELSVVASHSYLIGADILVVPFQKTVKQLPVLASQPAVQEVQRQTTVLKDVRKPAKPAKPEPLSKEREPIKPEPEKASIKEPKRPAVQESKVEEKKAAQAQPADVSKTQAAPQYIGTRQLHTMQIQRAIVEQVHMHWHPPEGLASDLEVVLVIHIASNGDVADVETHQSSGVFAYDVHARSAVYEMSFPKACWGKTVTISFK